jgi:hypothetical protein
MQIWNRNEIKNVRECSLFVCMLLYAVEIPKIRQDLIMLKAKVDRYFKKQKMKKKTLKYQELAQFVDSKSIIIDLIQFWRYQTIHFELNSVLKKIRNFHSMYKLKTFIELLSVSLRENK